MENVLIFIGGVVLGAYFAEPVRKVAPILDPNAGDK